MDTSSFACRKLAEQAQFNVTAEFSSHSTVEEMPSEESSYNACCWQAAGHKPYDSPG